MPMEGYSHHLMSHPSSPQSSALPSPPSSPGSSFSSLPSSAFSLSLPSSPPRHDSPLPHATHSLVLPSLSLDTSEGFIPHLNGELLGHVNLIIMGGRGCGKTLFAETLVHSNPDVLDVGEWMDDPTLGKVLSAETRSDGGTVGSSGNIKLVEVAGFDQTDDPQLVVTPILDAIQSRFRAVLPLLSPTHPSDSTLRDLLASPQSPLFTAILLLTSSPPTSLETTLLSMLSTHIPVIPVASPSHIHVSRPSSRTRSRAPRGHVPSLRSLTPIQFRMTMFRRPAALRKLRYEAAERFLWWREVQAGIQQANPLQALLRGNEDGDLFELSEMWEWELELSRDIALAKEAVVTEEETKPPSKPTCFPELCLALDPLHLPTLLLLSLSLLRPLRDSAMAGVRFGLGMRWLAATVVGAFCAGAGVGWLLSGA